MILPIGLVKKIQKTGNLAPRQLVGDIIKNKTWQDFES
jgi:hypothetical protein